MRPLDRIRRFKQTIEKDIAMPLYDFQCADCGRTIEALVMAPTDQVECSHCGSRNLKKLLGAHSSLSGSPRGGLPGPGDTACCGGSPGHGGCAGPGSCCGKN